MTRWRGMPEPSENPIYTIAYGDTPPSLNRLGTRGSHWQVNREKKRWQGILEVALLEARVPRHWPFARAWARAHLTFPERRRRDAGNFSWLLEKALGDALVNGGWLTDDTADRYSFERVHFEPVPGPARTVIVLEVER